MTADLTLSREHLGHNRRMIVARSLAAAIAGAVPLPIVDDWLVWTVQRSMLRRIASERNVGVDDAALRAIALGDSDPPQWAETTGSAFLAKLARRSWRKVLVVYMAARRAQAATRNFMIGTLFDHYCARMHVGLGLDAGTAMGLRRLMDRAIEDTPGGLGRRVFRRGIVGALKATVRAPVELADIASGGAVRRLLAKRAGASEAELVEEVETALEQDLQAEQGLLARAAAAVELELSAEGNPYIDRVVERFELLWRREHDKTGTAEPR